LILDSLTGRDSYQFYCASCHGSAGKGDGPVASSLKTVPADLTRLARRNGGTFPRQRVVSLVTGAEPGPTTAHGSSEMPVWGPVFRFLDPSDARVKVRIENVVSYIETLQSK
jgi:mono/diheme cytochrome c family protein